MYNVSGGQLLLLCVIIFIIGLSIGLATHNQKQEVEKLSISGFVPTDLNCFCVNYVKTPELIVHDLNYWEFEVLDK